MALPTPCAAYMPPAEAPGGRWGVGGNGCQNADAAPLFLATALQRPHFGTRGAERNGGDASVLSLAKNTTHLGARRA